MVLLLWGGAMGVDIGFTVVSGRQAQALADTGALDMARYVNLADSYNVLNYNSYLTGKMAKAQSDNNAGNVTFTVTGMFWSNTTGWTIPTGTQGCYNQFPAHNPPCTAVQVTATQNVPRIFAGGSGTVTRSSIAAVTPEDGFSIGTYLASINPQQSAVLNVLLSSLGTSVSLSALSFQGLANSYVTVQQLITASAGLLTPSNVMTTSLSSAQWLSILTTALNTQQQSANCTTSSVCAGYSALSSLTFGGPASAELCQLATVGAPNCPSPSGLEVSQAGLSASLNVLQMLTTEAVLANGTSALNVTSALGITGVSSATLSLTMVQPPQIAYGAAGVTANTAQMSADLQLVTPSGTVDIPVTAAKGTASLTSVTCSEANNSFSSAVVTASTTTATAAVTLNGSSIGALTMTGAGSTAKQFNSTVVPPTAATAQAIPPTNPVQLGSPPALSYTGLSALSPVYALLTSTLPAVLGPVLQVAGLSLGGANIADLNYNCGAVSLVK